MWTELTAWYTWNGFVEFHYLRGIDTSLFTLHWSYARYHSILMPVLLLLQKSHSSTVSCPWDIEKHFRMRWIRQNLHCNHPVICQFSYPACALRDRIRLLKMSLPLQQDEYIDRWMVQFRWYDCDSVPASYIPVRNWCIKDYLRFQKSWRYPW